MPIQAPVEIVRLTDERFPLYAFLKAVQAVENPNNVHAPGLSGALGPYQLKAITWRQHTTLPFTDDNVWEFGEGVAVKHARWLERSLKAHDRPVNAYSMALSWRIGVEGYVGRHWDVEDTDYAQRVANIVSEPRK